MTPAPYMDAASARILLIFALAASTVIVLLWLAALGCWLALRAACRKVRIMRARELPVVEDIPMRGGIYIPPDPVLDAVDAHAAGWADLNTHRYPCVTDADYPATAIRVQPWRWN